MSQEYFDNFPLIQYKNTAARNLLVRVGVRESTIKPNLLFMPLTVQHGERPDTVANDLYNISTLDWTIRLINNQVDPYFDWYLTTEQLEQFLKKKYGSLQAAYSTIVHYENVDGIVINVETYNLMTGEEQNSYTAVTAYDYENSINEVKNNILVASPLVIDEMSNQLEKKLNE